MNRLDRINSELKRQLAIILHDGVRDPRVSGLVSVMDVSVDKDLTLAKVYVSIFGQQGSVEDVLAGLNSAQGYIKSRLKNMMILRAIPSLRFILDTSVSYGMSMDKRLTELNKNDGKGRAD